MDIRNCSSINKNGVSNDSNENLMKRKPNCKTECKYTDVKKPKLIMKNQQRRFYLVFHLVTCGLQGNDLGRDETSILQFGFQIIDSVNLQIVSNHIYNLKVSSLLDPNADISKIHISVPAREMAEIGQNYSNFSTWSLENVLVHMHETYIKPLAVDNEVYPITMSHLPLRAVLHREARFRSIKLENYWTQYFELSYQIKNSTIFKIMDKNNDLISILAEANQVAKTNVKTTRDILSLMTQSIFKLLESKWEMKNIEIIRNCYYPAVFRRDDEIEADVVIMIKPIDYKTPLSQIVQFFNGINLAGGGIAILMAEGRRSNKILVRCENKIQRDIALMRDKHHFEFGSSRFITMTPSDSKEFMNIAGYDYDDVRDYLLQMKNEFQILVRMKGLPFTITKEDVLKFFNSKKVEIDSNEQSIFLVRKSTGEPNGDAFVIFENESWANKATGLKGECIGNRYIEIFQSTAAEMNQVVRGVKSNSSNNLPSNVIHNSNPGNILTARKLIGLDQLKSTRLGLAETGIVTQLIPQEAFDTDYVRYLGEMANLCNRVIRLMSANNPIGFTSYFAQLKNPTNLEKMLHYLQNRSLHVKSTQKDHHVINSVFPPPIIKSDAQSNYVPTPLLTNSTLISPLTSPISSIPSQFTSVVPNFIGLPGLSSPFNNLIPNAINLLGGLSYNASRSNLIAGHPGLSFPTLANPFITSPPSNATAAALFNSSMLTPSSKLTQFNPYLNTLCNTENLSLPLSSSSCSTTSAICSNNTSPVLINNNPLSYQQQQQQPLPNQTLTLPNQSNSRFIYLYGVKESFKQKDLDIIFDSIKQYISEMPQLLQNDKYFYASFKNSIESCFALKSCPLIQYDNQIIQLLPINE